MLTSKQVASIKTATGFGDYIKNPAVIPALCDTCEALRVEVSRLEVERNTARATSDHFRAGLDAALARAEKLECDLAAVVRERDEARESVRVGLPLIHELTDRAEKAERERDELNTQWTETGKRLLDRAEKAERDLARIKVWADANTPPAVDDDDAVVAKAAHIIREHIKTLLPHGTFVSWGDTLDVTRAAIAALSHREEKEK